MWGCMNFGSLRLIKVIPIIMSSTKSISYLHCRENIFLHSRSQPSKSRYKHCSSRQLLMFSNNLLEPRTSSQYNSHFRQYSILLRIVPRRQIYILVMEFYSLINLYQQCKVENLIIFSSNQFNESVFIQCITIIVCIEMLQGCNIQLVCVIL